MHIICGRMMHRNDLNAVAFPERVLLCFLDSEVETRSAFLLLVKNLD